jgi:hypothetical protein
MTLVLQPVRVATGTDEEGMLVFSGDRLVAVLVRLSPGHDELAGHWFLETGYGPLSGPDHPTFPDPASAQVWISRQLGERAVAR